MPGFRTSSAGFRPQQGTRIRPQADRLCTGLLVAGLSQLVETGPSMRTTYRSPWVSLIVAAAMLTPLFTAAESFRLTAGGPQSASLPWIGVIQTLVVPESNRRLAAASIQNNTS